MRGGLRPRTEWNYGMGWMPGAGQALGGNGFPINRSKTHDTHLAAVGTALAAMTFANQSAESFTVRFNVLVST